jgi:hypothetical protein
MSFPAGRTVYIFAGISLARVAESDEVVPWFFPEDQYTKDLVLGGDKVYLDIGAALYPPLTFRASCLSALDRFNLKAARGTVGTLTSTTGPFSATVLFYKAIPVNAGDYGRWYLDVGFELLPA